MGSRCHDMSAFKLTSNWALNFPLKMQSRNH